MSTYEEILERFRIDGKISFDLKTLSVSDHRGWSVAHELVFKGWRFWEGDVLRLADDNGYTVAHEMARCGAILDGLGVSHLATLNSVTVNEMFVRHNVESST